MISIILLTRNRQEMLDRCIKSIFEQTYKDWELLIFDHNSNAKVPDDPRIRYFLEPEESNIPTMRNKGTKEARGEWICVMDDDDEMMPDRLEKQIKVDADLIYSGREEHKDGKVEIKLAEPFTKNKLYNGSLIWHGTLLIKKEWLEKFPYDEGKRWGSDWKMALTMAKEGARFGWVEKPLLKRHWHGGNITNVHSSERIELVKRVREEMFGKKVSVIIPTYEKNLAEPLNALKLQAYKNFEVIITDDGSRNYTRDCDKYYWQKNKGYRLNSIRNAGAKMADGEILLYTDGDIVLIGEDFIERIVKWHKEHPRSIATFQRIRRFSDKLIADNKQPMEKQWHNFSGGMFSIEKEVFDEVGEWDEEYNGDYGWDDIDFAYRAIQKGIPIIVEKSFEVYHIEHPPTNKHITGKNCKYFNKKFNLETPKAGETKTQQCQPIKI